MVEMQLLRLKLKNLMCWTRSDQTTVSARWMHGKDLPRLILILRNSSLLEDCMVKNLVVVGEQGWVSRESVPLPPIWLCSIPSRHHLWVEFTFYFQHSSVVKKNICKFQFGQDRGLAWKPTKADASKNVIFLFICFATWLCCMQVAAQVNRI